MSEKLGLVGRKIGMTRIFTEDGVSIPVTVLEVSNNRITQVKTVETDGYNAVQVAFGSKKPSRVSKPLKGQFEKAGVEAGSMLKEFHVEEDKIGEMKVGQTLSIDMFSEGQKVDVTGTTIGKGLPAQSSVITSLPTAPATVTPCLQTPPVLSVTVRIRAVFSLASVWPVTSVMSSAQLRTWLSPVWTPIVN